MKQEVMINGMTCQGCANSVKTKFEQIEGINAVEIDLESRKAILDAELEIPKDTLKAALADTNYSVV